ncbi:DUF3231 family protein [Candidatus Formimonas warabiya]|uniref:Uncharacterized protein n=1 Tax=Formimonas warabiya TaxID=1761012 RepID=A0A3G1KMF1_FORW1|nr:DUF3231 family protein [Candidatus Formimonas warabiya]ATW23630.1 hypothetical protein DCMF_01380 [Candidatus Formimonas warabiya]
MKIFRKIHKISELGMSTKEKQRNVNVSEVFHLWNHLVQRYNVIYITDTLVTFARDEDLKIILNTGKKTLVGHIGTLEKEMIAYGIPLPIRPPKHTQTTSHAEQISDRYIFRRVLRGIQSFLPTHTMAFVHSTSPAIRELFMSFLIEEMKLYDKFVEYGKIKGYEIVPPMYRV